MPLCKAYWNNWLCDTKIPVINAANNSETSTCNFKTMMQNSTTVIPIATISNAFIIQWPVGLVKKAIG
jgi:hypothetical protein